MPCSLGQPVEHLSTGLLATWGNLIDGAAKSRQVSWERRNREERPSPPPDNDRVFPGFVPAQVND